MVKNLYYTLTVSLVTGSLVLAACGFQGQAPNYEATISALQVQGTQSALVLTAEALGATQTALYNPTATFPSPTATFTPTPEPYRSPTPEWTPTPTPSLDELIKAMGCSNATFVSGSLPQYLCNIPDPTSALHELYKKYNENGLVSIIVYNGFNLKGNPLLTINSEYNPNDPKAQKIKNPANTVVLNFADGLQIIFYMYIRNLEGSAPTPRPKGGNSGQSEQSTHWAPPPTPAGTPGE